jgi:hypothetical protein
MRLHLHCSLAPITFKLVCDRYRRRKCHIIRQCPLFSVLKSNTQKLKERVGLTRCHRWRARSSPIKVGQQLCLHVSFAAFLHALKALLWKENSVDWRRQDAAARWWAADGTPSGRQWWGGGEEVRVRRSTARVQRKQGRRVLLHNDRGPRGEWLRRGHWGHGERPRVRSLGLQHWL